MFTLVSMSFVLDRCRVNHQVRFNSKQQMPPQRGMRDGMHYSLYPNSVLVLHTPLLIISCGVKHTASTRLVAQADASKIFCGDRAYRELSRVCRWKKVLYLRMEIRGRIQWTDLDHLWRMGSIFERVIDPVSYLPGSHTERVNGGKSELLVDGSRMRGPSEQKLG